MGMQIKTTLIVYLSQEELVYSVYMGFPLSFTLLGPLSHPSPTLYAYLPLSLASTIPSLHFHIRCVLLSPCLDISP